MSEEDDALQKRRLEIAEKFGFKKPDQALLDLEAEQEKNCWSPRKQFPDSDGSERAFLKPNGDIVVEFSESSKGSHSVGSRTYSAEHELYQSIMQRHHLAERAQGEMHFIAQKYDDETKQWSDLGDGWFE